MAKVVSVSLHKNEDHISWGFRLQGGADFNQSLSIQRIEGDSIASQFLSIGDIILMIDGNDVRFMCHFEACRLIKMAGNSLLLAIRKANSEYLCDENYEQLEKLEEHFIQSRLNFEEDRRRRRREKELRRSSLDSESSLPSTPHSCVSPQEQKPLLPTKQEVFSPTECVSSSSSSIKKYFTSAKEEAKKCSSIKNSNVHATFQQHEQKVVEIAGEPIITDGNKLDVRSSNSIEENCKGIQTSKNIFIISNSNSNEIHNSVSKNVKNKSVTACLKSTFSSKIEEKKSNKPATLPCNYKRNISKKLVHQTSLNEHSLDENMYKYNQDNDSIYPCDVQKERKNNWRGFTSQNSKPLKSTPPARIFADRGSSVPPEVDYCCKDSAGGQINEKQFTGNVPFQQSAAELCSDRHVDDCSNNSYVDRKVNISQSSSFPCNENASCEELSDDDQIVTQRRLSADPKQRQLQLLIHEKVRLEELMMKAKRRQGEAEVKRKKYEERNTDSSGCELAENCTPENAAQKIEAKQNRVNSSNISCKSSSKMASNMNDKVKQLKSMRKQNEQKLIRQEIRLRDEKIRKMQELKYKEKIKEEKLKLIQMHFSQHNTMSKRNENDCQKEKVENSHPVEVIQCDLKNTINATAKVGFKSEHYPQSEEFFTKDIISQSIVFTNSNRQSSNHCGSNRNNSIPNVSRIDQLKEVNIKKGDHKNIDKNLKSNYEKTHCEKVPLDQIDTKHFEISPKNKPTNSLIDTNLIKEEIHRLKNENALRKKKINSSIKFPKSGALNAYTPEVQATGKCGMGSLPKECSGKEEFDAINRLAEAQENLLRNETETISQEVTLMNLKEEEQKQMETEAKAYQQAVKTIDEAVKRDNNDSRVLVIEETFPELQATSEEELYDAQEKSLRNLERQIKRQKLRKTNKCKNKSFIAYEEASNLYKEDSSEKELPDQEPILSDEIYHGYNLKRPVTKFKPDPMEFGFRPIEAAENRLSKSTGNLFSTPSAFSIVHVAGAEAGAAALTRGNRKTEITTSDRFTTSSSLENLQQISCKPPLPSQGKLKTVKMRHATSEEYLRTDERSEDKRRHTYADGDEFVDLSYFNDQPLNDYDCVQLMNEYYSAYYEAYYRSLFKKQQEELKTNKMSSAGGAPPPPPPPFKFPGMVTHQPKPPPSVVSEPPPTMAAIQKAGMPAALAGAMMKDKKPFTYTPGGLDLSEINEETYEQNGSANHQGVNVHLSNDNSTLQSKSFNTIQKAYETPSSTDSNAEEPRKYTGSNIPSRSFKALQAMTDSQASDDWNPGSSSESKRSEELPYPSKLSYNGNRFSRMDSKQHASPELTTSISSTASSFSSPTSFESDSRNVPCYSSARDNAIYRMATPQIKSSNAYQDRCAMNPNLSLRNPCPSLPQEKMEYKRPSSAMSQSSLSSDAISNTSYGFNSAESPSRLLSIIQQEKEKRKENTTSNKFYREEDLYPSKTYNVLLNGYSNNNQNEKPSQNSLNLNNKMPNSIKTNSKTQDVNPYSPTPSWSSTDQDEDHHDGIVKTVAAKQSVLKELTSHFDPKTSLKKPKAAPGRVFKYLQEQYDLPINEGSYEKQNLPVNCYEIQEPYICQSKPYDGSRIPGKTFRMLQENIETHPSVLQARK